MTITASRAIRFDRSCTDRKLHRVWTENCISLWGIEYFNVSPEREGERFNNPYDLL